MLLLKTENAHVLKWGIFISCLLILATCAQYAQAQSKDTNANSGPAGIPALSWTQGDPFHVIDGHLVYPPLVAPTSSQANGTHWYAGSAWNRISQNARTIYVNITVPPFAPESGGFYYVVLSAWDSAGSYDQLGFSDNFGAWGLSYSWTSGPTSSMTYHFSPEAATLSQGTTYTFNITTQSGYTYFTVYLGSNMVWSLIAPTGGGYLVLANTYSGYLDYTNYEEIWNLPSPGGSPAFDFNFSNNYWISTSNVSSSAGWETFFSGQPTNVGVLISGSSVLVNNPTVTSSVTLLPAGASIPVSAPNYFQVTYYLNSQPQIAYAKNGALKFIADRATNIVILGTSNSSTSNEWWVLNSRFAATNIPAGSAATFYYYDLLSQQVSYTTLGGGNLTNPILTYFTAPLNTSSSPNPTSTTASLPIQLLQTQVLVLRGTTATAPNKILGKIQDQWSTPTSSWNVAQANQIPNIITYYHQYQVTAAYSTSDGSKPPSTPLLSGTQLGANFQIPLTTNNQTIWLDANTSYLTSVIISASTGTERWASLGMAGNMTQTFQLSPVYTHQYYLAVNSTYGSPSGSGWYNSGSEAYASLNSGTISIGTGTQYEFASWSTGGNNYGKSNAIIMNSAYISVANWNTQYYLTLNSPYGSPSGSGWYNASTPQLTLA